MNHFYIDYIVAKMFFKCLHEQKITSDLPITEKITKGIKNCQFCKL